MTTALLLILPVIVALIVGVIAKIAIGSDVVDLGAISTVWPTVTEALPPVEPEHEHEDAVRVSKAA